MAGNDLIEEKVGIISILVIETKVNGWIILLWELEQLMFTEVVNEMSVEERWIVEFP